ncbi:MAG: sulfate reduction electron transfer complex DsrMKJOP subunit DsrP, partial [Thermodesulfobacteriota bacterium]
MLEKALSGSKLYWTLILALLVLIGIGFLFYLRQLEFGLGITGMNRDVTWGFYIAQFTFLVGVAASAVMLVLPYYLHDYKAFGKMTVLGEFLAVSAVLMCLLFIIIDLGQPARLLNVILYPTPHSMLFWDMIVLNGYLFLNIIIGWNVLSAEKEGVPPEKWLKPLIYLSIPFAISIHTVTAFLYSGLPGRGYWLTAVLAPKFLASAFAAGPAFLILLSFILRKFTSFDVGTKPIQTLAKIVCYATLASLFLFFCEVFVTFYSQLPGHMDHKIYLFLGLDGKGALIPWMWSSLLMLITAAILLLIPPARKNEYVLGLACIFIFFG